MTALQAYLQNPRTRKVLSKKPGSAGFSLIELVVVVAVLAILSAIAIPAFQNISDKARAAAASNTLATIIKECAVKLNDTGGTYSVPTLDGYRTASTSGWYAASDLDIPLVPASGTVGTGTYVAAIPAVAAGTYQKPTSPATCLASGKYQIVSDDMAKYPTFEYSTSTGIKKCYITGGNAGTANPSAASGRGCPVHEGAW